ncbi:hypothetical protein [Lederbergia citrea]|uniref:Uncharacterized protein n=1 Tax=Lederbergia citrea TaxID=2833581 RepID=A0A942Z402_9BACI|nr:hypothetical protein [Lederbergia citrea]MBS4178872.1 hypothetical protein [Lederbergia citrea]MBS4205553.1 hypothetical protein [Lederbergia citrea]MBS4224113.1 hypothetical protein [Lederbergia citrea]
MFELLLQDSYTEWVIPLTLAIVWILSWQLMSLSDPVYARRKMEYPCQSTTFIVPKIINERPLLSGLQLTKTVKRKECPDDPEGPHLSI